MFFWQKKSSSACKAPCPVSRNSSSVKQTRARHRLRTESGNVFFMLFAAVAVVGVLGAATVKIMRGPLNTMVEVNRRTTAESQIAITSKLGMMTSALQANNGDCETSPNEDGYVEPMEWVDASGAGPDGVSGSEGGGWLPDEYGVTKKDPWGTNYGYCVWDAGPVVNDPGCGGATQKRLQGSGTDNRGYPVIAIISAGPDRTFQTGCLDFATADANSNGTLESTEKMVAKASGSDDVVMQYTYAEASVTAGGLWELKPGTPDTAITAKNVEIGGTATFNGGVSVGPSGSGSFPVVKSDVIQPLSSGQAAPEFPSGLTLKNTANSGDACPAAELGRLSVDTSSPTLLLACLDNGGTSEWVKIGGANYMWQEGATAGEIFYNSGNVGIGTADPNYPLDVVGDASLTGDLRLANTHGVQWGDGTSSIRGSGPGNIEFLTGGATRVTVDSSGLIGIGVAPAASTRLTIQGTGTTSATTALSITDSAGAAVLTALDNAQIGIGTASPNDALDVTGAADVTLGYKIDGNTVLYVPDGADENILVGKDAGASVTGNNNAVLGASAAASLSGGTDNLIAGQASAISLAGGSFNTILGQGAGSALVSGSRNILIGSSDTTPIDVPGAGTSDYLNIGNTIFGDLANDRIGIGVASPTDALDVAGSIGATGAIDAGGNVNTGGNFTINSVVFGPAAQCTSSEKLQWSNTTGWSCITDLNDGSAGSPDTLEEVLTSGNDANTLTAVNLGGVAIGSATLSTGGTHDLALDVTGAAGADYYCDADGNNCFTAASVGSIDTFLELTDTPANYTGAGTWLVRVNSGATGLEFVNPATLSTAAAGNTGEIQFNNAGAFAASSNFFWDNAAVELGIGTNVPGASLDVATTDSVILPRGTAAQRSGTPVNGMIRYNNTVNKFEVYESGAWKYLQTGAATTLAYTDLSDTPAVYTGAAYKLAMVNPTETGMIFSYNDAVLLPSGTTAERPGTATDGMIRYNQTTSKFEVYQAGAWVSLITSGTGSALAIDDLTDALADYATDHNLIMGRAGATALTSGAQGNLFIGEQAGATTANSTSATDNNTAVGYNALTSLTTGYNNTASGYQALYSNTTGFGNTASGTWALHFNTTGGINTASGANALNSNTTGGSNTASGAAALYSNTTGNYNTASGVQALYSNTTGSSNTASGVSALISNKAKSNSTAIGYNAMYYADDTTTASAANNTALGFQALRGSTTASANTGTNNLALGYNALFGATSGGYNVAVGSGAGSGITSGANNIVIGYNVGTPAGTTSNFLNIGDTIYGDLSTDQIRIGSSGALSGFSDLELAGTLAVKLSSGTTAQRPGTATNGMIRYNSTANKFEVYENSAWKYLQTGAATSLAFTDLSDTPAVYTGAAYKLAMVNPTETGMIFSYNDAVLLPAGTTAERPGTATNGMIRYSNENNKFEVYQNGAWVNLITSGAGSALAIDDLTDAQTDYVTDHNLIMGRAGATALTAGAQYNVFIGEGAGATTANSTSATDQNTAVGYSALTSLTTGVANTASGLSTLYHNTTGIANTASGSYALSSNTTGSQNTAIGMLSLYSNVAKSNSTAIGYSAMQYADDTTTASAANNTAVGYQALMGSTTAANNTGTGNTALGASALQSNTTGVANTAMGKQALTSNTTGFYNTASGSSALYSNTTGSWNTASGLGTLTFNTTGNGNTASGAYALFYNTTGSSNIAIGPNALWSNKAKSNSTAIGYNAMQYADDTATAGNANNTALGYQALMGSATAANNTGTNNLALGYNALLGATSGGNNVAVGANAGDSITSGANNIVIGYNVDTPTATTSNFLNIGDTIYGDLSTDQIRIGGSGALSGFSDLDIAGTLAVKLSAGTTAQRPGTATNGMIRYNSDNNKFEVYENGSWANLVTSGASGSALAIDDLTDALADYATDHNLIMGRAGATALTSGAQYNVFIGEGAGATTANSTAATDQNTAVGYQALKSLTTGIGNTASGYQALYSNTSGTANTASGMQALYSNTTGNYNTANGYTALQSNTTGTSNTASGQGALYSNTTGNYNTANGVGALSSNTTGNYNTASGMNALYSNKAKSNSTAIGYNAMLYADDTTTAGNANNTALGYQALMGSATASANTGTNNLALGYNALLGATSGGNNVAVGASAGDSITTGANNIVIGYNVDTPAATTSNFINIGDSIYGDSSTDNVRIGGSGAVSAFSNLEVSGTLAVKLSSGTTAQRPGTPANGMIRYNSTNNKFEAYENGAWTNMIGAASGSLAIDDLSDAQTDYVTDHNLIMGRTGATALTSGAAYNVFIGEGAGATTANSTSLTDGNTAIGYQALMSLTSGNHNTASGYLALQTNNTGTENTANGYYALLQNTTGSQNTATGMSALTFNTTGSQNTANGAWALYSNTLGNYNTTIGYAALNSNKAKSNSTAVGYYSMYYADNTTTAGNANNTALGYQALMGSTTAANNTGTNNLALGYQALLGVTSGGNNVAVGAGAGDSITTGANNIVIGYNVDTPAATTSNFINIGDSIYGDSSTDNVRIGGSGAVSAFSNLEVSGTLAVKLSSGTTAQRPGTPANGMIRYNSTNNKFEAYENGAWTNMIGGAGSIAIDDLTDAQTDYVTDHNLIMGRTGATALAAGAQYNVFIGEGAGATTANSTSATDANTAVGYQALKSLTTGYRNTASGYAALLSNTTGIANTASGAYALNSNTTGSNNTASGYSSLSSNTTGSGNTANGYLALSSNTTGSNNVASGQSALYFNTTGSSNIASGFSALYSNKAKSQNTAIGHNAMLYADDTTTAGNANNTALGYQALMGSTTASANTGTNNLALGYNALLGATSGGNNVAVGASAGDSITTGANNIVIGYNVDTPAATTSNFINIGDSIYGDSSTDNVRIGGSGAVSAFSNLEVSGTLAVKLSSGTTAQRPGTPANGMIRYNSTNNKFEAYENGAWTNMIGAASGSLAIDDLSDAQTDYVTDHNLIMGRAGATALTAGAQQNVFIGEGAGATTANSTSTTDYNTAVGYQALTSLTTGGRNTANGYQALFFNTTGSINTALGAYALYANTTGWDNTASGQGALYSNTTGNYNTANGVGALSSNTTGNYNTASGMNALYSNKAKSNSTAIGYNAMLYADDTTTAGNANNTALGYQALMGSTTAANNTGTNNLALGYNALLGTTSGGNNVAVGASAGDSITTGANNIVIGYNVDTPAATTSNFINIGDTIYGDSSTDQIRIGGSGALSGFSDLDVAGTLAVKLSAGTTAQRPGTPANGMIRYNSTNNKFEAYENGAWTNMIGGAASIAIDDLTDAQTDYVTDHNLIMGRAGATALAAGAQQNVFIGEGAGATTANSTSATDYNTAAGYNALTSLTSGSWNTASGSYALYSNTTGNANTANGKSALAANTTGYYNTASGVNALAANTTGVENTASGMQALYLNTTGSWNTASGTYALYSNTTGYQNTASGSYALYSNTTGSNNTASGRSALYSNVAKSNSTAIGYQAMLYADNTTTAGNANNTALGYQALMGSTTASANTGTNNLALGYQALLGATSGGNNVAVGASAGDSITTGANNIVIGYNVDTPAATTSNFINIGDSIYGDSSTDQIRIGGSGALSGFSDLDVAGTLAVKLSSGTTAQRPGTPANGMIRYNSDNNKFEAYENGTWTNMIGGASIAIDDLTDAQADYVTDHNLIMGRASATALTTGAQYNVFIGEGSGATTANSTSATDQNTAVGYQTLKSLTTGYNNTASGFQALYSNTTGSSNTANGFQALYSNTTGTWNTTSGHQALYYNTTGGSNTANGYGVLSSNTTGNFNTASGVGALSSNKAKSRSTAIGYQAMLYADDTTTAGNANNTALGYQALRGSIAASTNTGTDNLALGSQALYSNTTGFNNTASGSGALYSNTTGIQNTASGASALYSNTTGGQNTASGASALYSNTTGTQDTANGAWALQSNTTGSGNTASGWSALNLNTTGSSNTASGYQALKSNQAKSNSTAIGVNAMLYADNTTTAGNANNTALGYQALRGSTIAANNTGTNNLALGYNALLGATSGGNNVAVGASAGDSITSGANNIVIGYNVDTPAATTSNFINIGDSIYGDSSTDQIRIGGSGALSGFSDLELAGTLALKVSSGTTAQRPGTPANGMIRYNSTTNAFEVYENSAWVALGAAVSDIRLKKDIKPLDREEIVKKLMQVDTYSFRLKADATGRENMGVIAQQIEKIFPDIVDGEGDEIKSVHYIELIAPLIETGKYLKAENDNLRSDVTELKEQVALLNKAAVGNTGKASMDGWVMLLLGLAVGGNLAFFLRDGMARRRKQG